MAPSLGARVGDWPLARRIFGEAYGSDGILTASAIPTRDEIVAWYAQFSFVSWWQTVDGIVGQLPYGARLAAGACLAVLGAFLVIRSYRIVRPTQGDLARQVALAARNSKADPTGALRAEPVSEPVSGPARVTGAPTVPARDAHGLDQPPRAPSVPPPLRPSAPKAFLTADQFTEGHAPWAVPLGHDLVRIGRHQENDIRLDDKTVHRYHALLHRSADGDFLIRDLSGEAGNGVYVNGARIEQAALRPGDLVELGAVRLRFQQQRPS